MQLTTKYSINDRCFLISREPVKTWIACPACEGKGTVTLANGERSCPDCYGRYGHWEHGKDAWQVIPDPLTIGEVRAFARNLEPSPPFENIGYYKVGADSFRVEYMCYETGIGSGTIYYEEMLWPDAISAAQECERLNAKCTNT